MIDKIYICIPGNAVTGGPETLHQFASIFSKYCDNTFVCYYGKSVTYETPDKYKKYNVKICLEIEDLPNNVMVVPEMATELLFKYRQIKKCVWWLSLDNYYHKVKPYTLVPKLKRNFVIKSLLYLKWLAIYSVRKIRGKVYSIDKLSKDTFHFYNCEYAKQFLLENDVAEENTMYLCGPLEKLYFEPLDKECVLKNKENIIAYNPAKDHKYITQLQKVNINNYQFVPIKGMTSQQVKELLLRTKLYVDFGYFPGPERIPRQAAMCYCSILTSNLGSAENDVDVPISRENKIDVKHFKPKEVYKKVISLIENFEQDISDYDKYREKVIRQDLDFEQSIGQFIQLQEDRL